MPERDALKDGEPKFKDRLYTRIFFPQSKAGRFLSGVFVGLGLGAEALHAAPTGARHMLSRENIVDKFVEEDVIKDAGLIGASTITFAALGGVYLDSLLRTDWGPISAYLPLPIDAPLVTIPIVVNFVSGGAEYIKAHSAFQKIKVYESKA